MSWQQNDAGSGALKTVLDELLGELGEFETEEKLLHERLEELSAQKHEAEAAVSYLRKRLKSRASRAPEPPAVPDTPDDAAAPRGAAPPPPETTSPPASKAPAATTPTKRSSVRQPGNTLLSPTGQTRYEFARTLIATAEHGVTTTMLAREFEGTAMPSGSRVEGARIALLRLVEEGLAERVGRNLYVAKRVPSQNTAASGEQKGAEHQDS